MGGEHCLFLPGLQSSADKQSKLGIKTSLAPTSQQAVFQTCRKHPSHRSPRTFSHDSEGSGCTKGTVLLGTAHLPWGWPPGASGPRAGIWDSMLPCPATYQPPRRARVEGHRALWL